MSYGDPDIYRVYADSEVATRDGYPAVWHSQVKDEVREAAGNRCVRCGHPYVKGAGEWSPCDRDCSHDGPIRAKSITGEWHTYEGTDAGPLLVMAVEKQARWRILTVHHLTGVKGDLRWWNLAALCQRCHLQIQGRVRMERTWPWEHSEWFRPYVAGYYAWMYRGENLTPEQVDGRLAELLALEGVTA